MEVMIMAGELLRNRLCLVTGSSRGLGLGIARSLAAHGAVVVVHGRDETRLRAALNELPGAGPHHSLVADLAEDDGPQRLAGEVLRRWGRLEVLIHSAGILGPMRPLKEYPSEAWDAVLRINLTAPFLLTRALLPALARGDRPAVVFISSGVGRTGRAGWGAYAVSKFGVEGLTQVWAHELGKENIRVNAVNPGGTRTQMRALAYSGEDPLSLPTPEEIAPVFVWLARPDTPAAGKSLEARDWIGRDPAA
jgi:NAD(P)-dependent dehydrogenase (short-subunit alcohol dehydrogenase family)